jgi:hypothetical protein
MRLLRDKLESASLSIEQTDESGSFTLSARALSGSEFACARSGVPASCDSAKILNHRASSEKLEDREDFRLDHSLLLSVLGVIRHCYCDGAHFDSFYQ